jgi:CheY-like chemotaxis protein
MFQDSGNYRLAVASGGPAGWEALSKHPPQAVILDLFMPDLDGFTILEKMRENPRLRDVPVVVVSGGDLSAEQRQQLTDFGQRLVRKGSIDEKDLLGIIERTLKRVKAQQRV